MNVPVANLEGRELARAFYKATRPELRVVDMICGGLGVNGSRLRDPCISWEVSGPVFEREGLNFTRKDSSRSGGVWASYPGKKAYHGVDMLQAGLRAFVAAHFGEEIELK